MAQSHNLGKKGETIACEFLKSLGFKIIARNYRWQKIEVDIIAQNQDYIIFVEVKTRTRRIEQAMQFIPMSKQNRMVRLADAYIQANEIDKEVRFDLIIIDVNDNYKLTHYPSVFVPQW